MQLRAVLSSSIISPFRLPLAAFTTEINSTSETPLHYVAALRLFNIITVSYYSRSYGVVWKATVFYLCDLKKSFPEA